MKPNWQWKNLGNSSKTTTYKRQSVENTCHCTMNNAAIEWHYWYQMEILHLERQMNAAREREFLLQLDLAKTKFELQLCRKDQTIKILKSRLARHRKHI